MKPKELLFLAVAFFLGYFANTIINMTYGRSVVEGVDIPKCRGRWLGAGGAPRHYGPGNMSRFDEYEFTPGECPPPDSEYWGSWDYCCPDCPPWDGKEEPQCTIPVEGSTWDSKNNKGKQCGRKPNTHDDSKYEEHECIP